MPVSPDELKGVMSRIAATVTVVTSYDDVDPIGLTVSSFTSVSADPAIILVCLGTTTASLQPMLAADGFTVNVMPRGTEDEALAFATRGSAGFDQAKWRAPDSSGAGPVLHSSLASLECASIGSVEMGDHWVLYGEVLATAVTNSDLPPLVWLGRGFVDLAE